MITMAFTRPKRRLDDSIEEAKGFGFRVIAAPSLDIIHGDTGSYDSARKELSEGSFGTVIFSSATAVEECHKEWADSFKGLMEGAEVIAIGPGTSRSLEGLGIEVSSIPKEYTSSGLVELLRKDTDGRSVLIIHSDRGSTVLRDGLVESGFSVKELIAYTLEKHDGGLDEMREEVKKDGIDVFAFTSRMSVESFLDSIGLSKEDVFSKAKVAAIGQPTKEKLEEEGISVDIMPPEATFRSLLQSIKDYFTGSGKE